MVERRPSPSPKRTKKKMYVLDDRANQPKEIEPALRSPHQCKGGISIILFIRIVVVVSTLSVPFQKKKLDIVKSDVESRNNLAHPIALPISPSPAHPSNDFPLTCIAGGDPTAKSDPILQCPCGPYPLGT